MAKLARCNVDAAGDYLSMVKRETDLERSQYRGKQSQESEKDRLRKYHLEYLVPLKFGPFFMFKLVQQDFSNLQPKESQPLCLLRDQNLVWITGSVYMKKSPQIILVYPLRVDRIWRQEMGKYFFS